MVVTNMAIVVLLLTSFYFRSYNGHEGLFFGALLLKTVLLYLLQLVITLNDDKEIYMSL